MNFTRTCGTNGRLGNQLFRNLAVSILAEIHDLYVEYSSHELIARLGIVLFVGSTRSGPDNPILLTDENYFELMNSEFVACSSSFSSFSLNANEAYFQSAEICRLLHNYLHSPSIQSRIVAANPFRDRYGTNNDVAIHVRLTDMAHNNPGIEYYLTALSRIPKKEKEEEEGKEEEEAERTPTTTTTIYICSDDISHPVVRDLVGEFPSGKVRVLAHVDEITTFQFASTCKTVILSHGSFSAMIGYLSFFATTVMYPAHAAREGGGFPESESESDRNNNNNNIQNWYGRGMFCIDDWDQVCLNEKSIQRSIQSNQSKDTSMLPL